MVIESIIPSNKLVFTSRNELIGSNIDLATPNCEFVIGESIIFAIRYGYLND